ncbi:hypothetical protein TNCV_1701021 [Trichonephila clavipes]|nr:hypothetical protein TNCV_1701021 [Trichonephila clavipes]
MEDCGCYSDFKTWQKNSALAESYLPISLLHVLSKLAERVILARLSQRPSRKRKYPDSGVARVPTSSLHLPSTSQSR